MRSEPAAGRAEAAPPLPAQELVADGEEDLARIAVIGGQHPFLAERGFEPGHTPRGPGRRAIVDIFAGVGVHVHEVIAGDDVALVGEVLAVQPDGPVAARKLVDRAGIPQCKALLVEPRAGDLELLALAAVADGRKQVELTLGQRRFIAKRSAGGPFGRVLDLAEIGEV
jgi:hypothetical protein